MIHYHRSSTQTCQHPILPDSACACFGRVCWIVYGYKKSHGWPRATARGGGGSRVLRRTGSAHTGLREELFVQTRPLADRLGHLLPAFHLLFPLLNGVALPYSPFASFYR